MPNPSSRSANAELRFLNEPSASQKPRPMWIGPLGSSRGKAICWYFYKENGKENGNSRDYRDYIIAIIEGVHRGYIGIIEKKMEATTWALGVAVMALPVVAVEVAVLVYSGNASGSWNGGGSKART